MAKKVKEIVPQKLFTVDLSLEYTVPVLASSYDEAHGIAEKLYLDELEDYRRYKAICVADSREIENKDQLEAACDGGDRSNKVKKAIMNNVPFQKVQKDSHGYALTVKQYLQDKAKADKAAEKAANKPQKV